MVNIEFRHLLSSIWYISMWKSLCTYNTNIHRPMFAIIIVNHFNVTITEFPVLGIFADKQHEIIE